MYYGKKSHPRKGTMVLYEDGIREFIGPVTRNVLALKSYNDGRVREGVYYNGTEVNRWVVAWKWATQTEMLFMNIIESLKENYEAASALWKSYDDKLKEFRGVVKNDVASLEASARKTAEAVQKMNKAYNDVLAQMNGEEMALAIQNAERLAAALKSLSELQVHTLNFTVQSESHRT